MEIHKQCGQQLVLSTVAFEEQCRSRDNIRIVFKQDGRRRVRDMRVPSQLALLGTQHDLIRRETRLRNQGQMKKMICKTESTVYQAISFLI